MDTLSLTVDSTILFAMWFVAVSLLYELFNSAMDRKAPAKAALYVADLPVVTGRTRENVVYLPTHHNSAA